MHSFRARRQDPCPRALEEMAGLHCCWHQLAVLGNRKTTQLRYIHDSRARQGNSMRDMAAAPVVAPVVTALFVAVPGHWVVQGRP